MSKYEPSSKFLELLDKTREACLENRDLASMYASYYRPNRPCNLYRFSNFDSDNREAFINMISLRQCDNWDDELMFKLSRDLIEKWEFVEDDRELLA